MNARVLGAVALLGALIGFPSDVLAQVSDIGTPSIGIERFGLEPGPGGVLGAADAEVLAPGSMHFAVMASLMSRPIVLAELEGGEERSVPIRLRLTYELALARGISKRLQLGVAMPIVGAQDGDRLQGIGLSEQSLAPVAVGDIRIHAKLRLTERPGSRLNYGVAMRLRLPSGDEEHFAGEAGVVVSWSLVAGYAWRSLRLVANLGLRIRTKEVALISPARAHANELVGLVAGEYRLPWFPVGILGEYAKVRGDGLGPSPGELRGGIAAYILPRATLKLAIGRGTTPGEVGSPDWRVMTVFQYEGR